MRYWKPFKSIFWSWLAMISIVIFGIVGCMSFDYLTQVEDTYPKAEQCGKCHIDIYREWSQSPHANSFISNTFKQATNAYQFADCLGCHAPLPTLSSQEPSPRTADRQEGVTCVSCHLEEGKMSGPLDPTGKVAPHPINVSKDRYRQSQFCGRCHQGTLRELQAASPSQHQSCQDCHMPEVQRKVTQPTDFMSKIIVSMEKVVEQKQHLFTIDPNYLAEAPFQMECRKNANTLTVILKNLLPHTLPTGDFGVRIVTFQMVALRTDHTEVVLGKFELVKEIKTALGAGSSRTWNFTLPPNVQAIRGTLFRHGRQGQHFLKLYSQEVSLK